MSEAALRTAQAARSLGISPSLLRRLYKYGLVEAEETPGGHVRYPLAEITRLQKEGLPEIPVELPDEPSCDDLDQQEVEPREPRAHLDEHPRCVATPHDDEVPPLSDAVAAAEDEARVEECRARTDATSLHRLKLKLEREQVNDQFVAREQRDRQAKESEQARQRGEADAQAREQRRYAFQKRWLEYAILKLPAEMDGAPHVEGILKSVLNALQELGEDVPDWAVRRVVDTQVASALGPWRQRKEVDTMVETACSRLPSGMQRNTSWRFRAIEAATKVLNALRPEANPFEKQTAIEHAMNLVKADFEYLERRESKVKDIWLREATSNEREAARDSVRQALEALPIRSSDREVEAARDAALGSHVSALRTRKDREMRENLFPYWLFNYVPASIEEALKKELQKAIDAYPEGTPQQQLEKVRDQIIDKRRSERRTKEALINVGLNEIVAYVQTLRREWDGIPDELNGLWKAVREHLEQEISHETPTEEVPRLVRRKIRRYFRIR